MKIRTLNELYIEELRDLYSAEAQIVAALPKVAAAIHTLELCDAVKRHLEQSKGHVARLETIFQELGESPKGVHCTATEGLLKEGVERIEEIAAGPVRDAALIGAAQKIEHYEIAGYGTARAFAEILGHARQIGLLQQTLDEEAQANDGLTKLAGTIVNPRASESNVAVGAAR